MAHQQIPLTIPETLSHLDFSQEGSINIDQAYSLYAYNAEKGLAKLHGQNIEVYSPAECYESFRPSGKKQMFLLTKGCVFAYLCPENMDECECEPELKNWVKGIWAGITDEDKSGPRARLQSSKEAVSQCLSLLLGKDKMGAERT